MLDLEARTGYHDGRGWSYGTLVHVVRMSVVKLHVFSKSLGRYQAGQRQEQAGDFYALVPGSVHLCPL